MNWSSSCGASQKALRSAALYEPINCLKPVCGDVWIVDGPQVRFGFGWPKLPFTTRMTILRLGSRLFVHSPTPLTDALREQLATIGTVAWLVEPNRIHSTWITSWQRSFPAATVYLAPGINSKVSGLVPHVALTGTGPYPWDDCIRTLPIVSAYMTEFEFFHVPSGTLVLTDLLENFEPARLHSRPMRWITRVAGVAAPDGGMPIDMKLTFVTRRRHLRDAVTQMLNWNPERIIISHGRWFETNGADTLRSAFQWLM